MASATRFLARNLLTVLVLLKIVGAIGAVVTIEWALPFKPHNVSASVNDIVAFDFTTGHTVVRMPSAEALASCDFSNSASLATSGPVGFRMPNVPTLYFACSVANHCAQGMQVTIVQVPNTTTTPTSANATHAPTTAHPTEIITSSPQQNSAEKNRYAILAAVLVTALVPLLLYVV
jgi:hypothetical protein